MSSFKIQINDEPVMWSVASIEVLNVELKIEYRRDLALTKALQGAESITYLPQCIKRHSVKRGQFIASEAIHIYVEHMSFRDITAGDGFSNLVEGGGEFLNYHAKVQPIKHCGLTKYFFDQFEKAGNPLDWREERQ